MTSIFKTLDIAAPIGDVFEALTNEQLIEKWSGSRASMNLKGDFSLWGGDIHGVNTLISPNLIKQKWKVKSWKQYSWVIIKLKDDDKKTILELEHTNIPDTALKDLDNGWDQYYLEPLKELVEQRHMKTEET